jgi:hypothetical protein
MAQQWDNIKRPVQAGYPQDDVQRYCVRDGHWQRFRLKLKGLSTVEKLDRLERWWDDNQLYPGRTEVQVGNYLGALRRGGQLDMNNKVQR